jgi:hypothetical protein
MASPADYEQAAASPDDAAEPDDAGDGRVA